MKPPAIDSAVQTTPPIIMAAIIPLVPLNPALTNTKELKINVINVIPDTGFEPTIAIAFAATVVNRNEMTNTIKVAMIVCVKLPNTPNWKNTKVAINMEMIPDKMNFMEISRCVRSTAPSPFFFPPNSLTANPKACLIILEERIIPITPAIAIPPIPI